MGQEGRNFTSAFNVMWVDLAPATPGQTFKPPLSWQHLLNLKSVARANPDSNILLWVDSNRLSTVQYNCLRSTVERHFPSAGISNVGLRDLFAIEQYKNEGFYRKPTSESQKNNYRAPIWGQVDSARLLALSEAFKDGFDQAAYCDFDLLKGKGIILSSEAIQAGLKTNHVVLGLQDTIRGGKCAQNNFMAFTSHMRESVKHLYDQTIKVAREGNTGYGPFLNFVSRLRTHAPDPTKLFLAVSGGLSNAPLSAQPKPDAPKASGYYTGYNQVLPAMSQSKSPFTMQDFAFRMQ
jgi:hypothetical protein